MADYFYGCECDDLNCKLRVRMPVKAFEVLSRRGAIRSAYCKTVVGKLIVARYQEDIVVVPSKVMERSG